MANPAGRLDTEDRDLLVWPDVVAATVMGDDTRYFVEASTNNNETPVKVYIYWHIPEDGDGPPVLMIEVDDDVETEDIYLRIRRNDGLVAQGTPAEMQYMKEEP